MILKNVLQITYSLSVGLQSRQSNLSTACEQIEATVQTLMNMRESSVVIFTELWSEIMGKC